MRLYTAEQMKLVDKHAIETVGIPCAVLMENAGIKSLMTLEKILGGLKNKRFTIVCGKGNNGGDGLVIARHMFNNRVPVHVFLTTAPEEMTPDARANLEILVKCGASPVLLKETSDLNKLRIGMEFSECVIDCIFGTGIKGNISGFTADIIAAMNESRAIKIAIDLPSGVCGTTGRVYEPSFAANYTIALGAPKVGLFMPPAKKYTGEVWIADIGLPEISFASAPSSHTLLTASLCNELMRPRLEGMNKGDAGKALIAAGSMDYPGAAVLASYGALRSGAGIVRLMLPDCLQGNMPFQILPETIVNYTPSKDGGFDITEDMVKGWSDKYGCILIGSGWGRSSSRSESMRNVLKNWRGTLVADADALNMTDNPEILRNSRAQIIITPHLAEMARLTGKTIEEIKDNQIETAREFAVKNRLTVVLKSSVTVVAEQNGQVYLCSRENSGLARGGSGDLLAGLICGLASARIKPAAAALIGVWIHSEAGEIARTELGAEAMTISETASFIPAAFKKTRG